MSELEQASKGMMNKLNYIRAHALEYQTMPSQFLNDVVEDKYVEISEWYWQQRSLAKAQFKLIEHVFGDTPQFEEKPKKYVVRNKKMDDEGDFRYLIFQEAYGVTYTVSEYVDNFYKAKKFNTREEAEKWTNPLMEVVEVEEDER